MWSSVAVLVGLGGVALGYAWADAAAAIVVAVFICIAGWRLGRRTIDTLTDTAPEGVGERVTAIARQVPGVVAVERVRARPAGAVLFVDLARRRQPHAAARPRHRASRTGSTRAIRAEMPNAEVTVTTEPRALDDETRARTRDGDRAQSRRSPCITSPCRRSRAGWRYRSISKSTARMALGAAHEIASGLEEAVRDELGPDVEVETHIEPLPADVLAGRDAPAARIAEVREALAALAAEIAGLGEVHDVRVRETARRRDRQFPLPRRSGAVGQRRA